MNTTIDVNKPITFADGSAFQFVRRVGSVIRLRSQADGSYQDMHIAELSAKVPAVTSFLPSAADYRLLPVKQQVRVSELAGHVAEVLTGVNPNTPDVLREEYDLTRSQNQRVESKMRELGLSRATLMRHIKAYREKGPAALADARTIRRYGPLANLDPRVHDAMRTVLAANANASTKKRSTIIRQTEVELASKFGPGSVAMPSPASMYRYLDLMTKGRHTFDSASTKRSLANRPVAPFARREQRLAGAEVQIDSTTLDLLVRGPKNKKFRPILTVMHDRATRMVIAYTLRMDAAKGVDHVLLLAQALTPPQNRPEMTSWRERVRRMNPQAPLMTDEERAFYLATAPYIRPLEVVIDNGKDFLSNAFQAALQRHQISVRFSAPHTPTGKPLVERNFGSVGSLFVEHLQGHVGRSPEYRGYKVEDEGLMDIFALHEAFDDWLLKTWNHRLHRGLSDPMFPDVNLTPYQAYQASIDVTSQIQTTLTAAEYLEMLPVTHRKVTSTGVAIKRRHYDSPLLNPLRHAKSSNPREKGQWEVRYDPYNPMYVWVRGEDGTLIQCVNRDSALAYVPFLEGPDQVDEERVTVATIGAHRAGTPAHTGYGEAIRIDPVDDSSDETDDVNDSITLL